MAIEILACSFAWWFGLYLLARDPQKALLRRTGLGLIVYALALALDLLRGYASPALAEMLLRAHWALMLLPALFWSGALVLVLPDDMPLRNKLDRAWRYGLAPAVALAALLVAGVNLAPVDAAGAPRLGVGYLLAALLALAPLLAMAFLVWRVSWAVRPRHMIGLLLAATLFFALGAALLIVPLGWLPHSTMALAIGLDLELLGAAITMLDAFDEGETLRADIVRSFVAAGWAALLFGLQVALAIVLGTGATFPMVALLVVVVATSIAAQTFAEPIQAALDRLAFAGAPRLRRQRADLRAAASALPRVNAELDPASLDAAEFDRLTRRALSHYGDLPRLASSPLARLPIVDARLAARGAPDNPLERAAELKALLAESIARLKPRDQGDFGVSDEWRHYNALFFPYVVGLKPYSRRGGHDELDEAARKALEWLAGAVPERTLHNWQNAAARLVAQDLRGARRVPDLQQHIKAPKYQGSKISDGKSKQHADESPTRYRAEQ